NDRALPEIAAFALCEQRRGVASRRERQERDERCEYIEAPPCSDELEENPQRQRRGVRRDNDRAPCQPTLPLRPRENCPEALGAFEIANEQRTGEAQEYERKDRRDESGRACRDVYPPIVVPERGDEPKPGRDSLRPDVRRNGPAPRALARN